MWEQLSKSGPSPAHHVHETCTWFPNTEIPLHGDSMSLTQCCLFGSPQRVFALIGPLPGIGHDFSTNENLNPNFFLLPLFLGRTTRLGQRWWQRKHRSCATTPRARAANRARREPVLGAAREALRRNERWAASDWSHLAVSWPPGSLEGQAHMHGEFGDPFSGDESVERLIDTGLPSSDGLSDAVLSLSFSCQCTQTVYFGNYFLHCPDLQVPASVGRFFFLSAWFPPCPLALPPIHPAINISASTPSNVTTSTTRNHDAPGIMNPTNGR